MARRGAPAAWVIGPSRHGRGVFSQRDLTRGELILTMRGPRIPEQRVESKRRNDDPLQVSPRMYLDLRPPGVLVNHSCAPSAGLRGDIELVALRAIARGEEITYDYSTTIENDTVCSFACACGAARCRGLIGDFSDLPRAVQRRYRDLGVVQRFIAGGYRRRS